MEKIISFFKKQKIGLALSGGATKGFATFAIISQLEKENIKIDYISGTSVGAIIGAYYSIYGEIDSLRNELTSFDNKQWSEFADFSLTSLTSIIKAKKYKKYLLSKFENKTFDDCKIPLVITATNLRTGKLEYFKTGKIIDALLASSAYPGIFPPHKLKNNIYVDGGVLNNLPYEILFEEKMNKVIAINLGIIHDEKDSKYKTLFNVISRSIDLMIANALKKINYENKNLFIIEPKFSKGFNSTWNTSDLEDKYKIGVKEFNNRKDELFDWLKK